MNSSAASDITPSAGSRKIPLSLFRHLFSSYLGVVEQNATRIVQDHDADAEIIHDFRIALRRIETVLKQFRTLVPRHEYKWFLGQFKELRDSTNRLRDADIFLEHLEIFHDEGPFNGLKEKVLNGHQKSMNIVQASCNSWLNESNRSEYRERVIDRIDRQLQKQAVEQHDEEPTREMANWIRIRLAKRGRKIFRSKLNWKGWTRLHERRIDVKQLRYAMELYREFLPQDEYEAIYRRLKSLQNRLGTINDEVTISAQLKKWKRSTPNSSPEKKEIIHLQRLEKEAMASHLDEFNEWWTRTRRRKWKKQWKELLDKLAIST
ncbi:MAG: CHAD domain-containing protein [Planctomycetota bacterium]|nr:CHAD domain-containing protein [Planctomycetota bacterium]